MRKYWIYYVSGFFLVSLVAIYVRSVRVTLQSASAETDVRVKQLDNSELAERKTKIPSAEEMQNALAQKEQQLESERQRLKEKEDLLRVEESRFKEKIEDMGLVQEEISKIQEQNKQQSDAVLGKIVKTYENMAPKKAAGVISVMADPLAVEVLMKMKEKKVASILEVMEPNRAMALTSLLADKRPAGRAIGEGKALPLREPGSKK